jgi:hypothetical protein
MSVAKKKDVFKTLYSALTIETLNIACELIDESRCAFSFFFNLLQDEHKAQHKKCDVQIAIAKVAIDELGYDAVAVFDEHGISLMIKI